jgi:hypothetical protein
MITVWFHSSQRYPSVLVRCMPADWGWWAIISLKSIPAAHKIDNAAIRGVRSGVI